MRLHRLLWCSLLLLLACVTRPIRAETVARVVIVRPAGGDALLNEALIRTRGELAAVGLTVEVELAEERTASAVATSTYGTLVFERVGPRLEIQAFAPGLEQPVVQILDTARPGIDAEVVSVRAVEALRAAMLQYVKRARAAEQRVPDAVVGFTKQNKLEPAPSAPAATAEPVEAPESDPAPSEQRRTSHASERSRQLRWNVWIGPELSLDANPSLPSVGARLNVYGAFGWLAAGLGLDQGYSATRVEASEGNAKVARTALVAQLKAELPLSATVSPFFQLGFGARRYKIDSAAEPGFGAHTASHWSLLTTLDLGSTYRLFRSVGAYLSLGARFATDAPELQFADRTVAVLDRPALSVAAGLIVGSP
jgi:hypothetical protein